MGKSRSGDYSVLLCWLLVGVICVKCVGCYLLCVLCCGELCVLFDLYGCVVEVDEYDVIGCCWFGWYFVCVFVG